MRQSTQAIYGLGNGTNTMKIILYLLDKKTIRRQMYIYNYHIYKFDSHLKAKDEEKT
jgi:hypothetical protein